MIFFKFYDMGIEEKNGGAAFLSLTDMIVNLEISGEEWMEYYNGPGRKRKNKAVLQFVLRFNDKLQYLTLGIYPQEDGVSEGEKPTLYLNLTTTKISEPITTDVILGDQQLGSKYKRELKEIEKTLTNPDEQKLVFVPSVDVNDHLFYRIHVVPKDFVGELSNLTAVTQTDPCPPAPAE